MATSKTAKISPEADVGDEQNAENNSDVAGMTYEQARTALGEIVVQLEAGGTTLEESLTLWQRGEAIADVCDKLLNGAQDKLDATLAAREA